MEPGNLYIPVLAIKSGTTDIAFYTKAFGAIELWRIPNPDGTVHVAAFSINGATFRLHEEGKTSLSPDKAAGTTVTIALATDDVHAVFEQAVAAGATALSPVIDYEYGYRQGDIQDPHGHHWIIEKLIDKEAFDNFLRAI